MSSDLMAGPGAVGDIDTSPDSPPVVTKPPDDTYKYCTAEGCDREICLEKAYYRRFSLCKTHLRASRLVVQGKIQRFCNQCSRFQPVEDFDGDKRSCRETSARHTLRRRQKLQEARMRTHSMSDEGDNVKQLAKTSGVQTADGAAASSGSVIVNSASAANTRKRPANVAAGTSSTQVMAATQVTVSELPAPPSGAEGPGVPASDLPVRLPDRPMSNSSMCRPGSQQMALADPGCHPRGSSKGTYDMRQYDSGGDDACGGWTSDGVHYLVPGRQAVERVRQAQVPEGLLSSLMWQPSGSFVTQPSDVRARGLPEPPHTFLNGGTVTARSAAAPTGDLSLQPLQHHLPQSRQASSIDSHASLLMSYDVVTTTNAGMASAGSVLPSARYDMPLESRATPAKRIREDSLQEPSSISAPLLSFRPQVDDTRVQQPTQLVASIKDNLQLTQELKFLLQTVKSEQQQTETLPSHLAYCTGGKNTAGGMTRHDAEQIGGMSCHSRGGAFSREMPNGVRSLEQIISSRICSQGQAAREAHVPLQGLPANYSNVRIWAPSRGSSAVDGPQVQPSLHITNGQTPGRRVASDLLLARCGGMANSGTHEWSDYPVCPPQPLSQTSFPSTSHPEVNCGMGTQDTEKPGARWRLNSVQEAVPLPPASSSLPDLDSSGHPAAAAAAFGRPGRRALPIDEQRCSRPLSTLPPSPFPPQASVSVHTQQYTYSHDDAQTHGQWDRHQQHPAPSASWARVPVADWQAAGAGQLPATAETLTPQRPLSQAPTDPREHQQQRSAWLAVQQQQQLQTHQESVQQLFCSVIHGSNGS